jgi:hypothetical protein
LKVRPPGGAAPSLVPNSSRKKRKEVARGRDLCDRKIKITESFGSELGSAKVYTIERVRKEVLHRPMSGGGHKRREAELQRIDGAISAPADHGRCDQSHHQQQLEEGVNSLSMGIGGSDYSHASFPPGAMATASRGDNVCGGGNSPIVSELLADRDSYGVPGLLGEEVHRLQLRRRKELKKTQASLFMKQLFPPILLLDTIDGPHCICIIFSKWCLPVSCQATVVLACRTKRCLRKGFS